MDFEHTVDLQHEMEIHRMIEDAGGIDPVFWMPVDTPVFRRTLPIYDFATKKLVAGKLRQAIYVRAKQQPIVIPVYGQQIKLYKFVLENIGDIMVAP